jgi:hypothetical protein
MKPATIVYIVVGAAAVIAALLIPWLVHRQGSESVPGWRGWVNPGSLSERHAFLAGSAKLATYRTRAQTRANALHATRPAHSATRSRRGSIPRHAPAVDAT